MRLKVQVGISKVVFEELKDVYCDWGIECVFGEGRVIRFKKKLGVSYGEYFILF